MPWTYYFIVFGYISMSKRSVLMWATIIYCKKTFFCMCNTIFFTKSFNNCCFIYRKLYISIFQTFKYFKSNQFLFPEKHFLFGLFCDETPHTNTSILNFLEGKSYFLFFIS